MKTVCETCKTTKDAPLKYTKCQECGGWREMTADEQAKVDKRKR